MNDTDIHKASKLASPQPRGELCELCACRDQEDIYIVFDVLYRVFMMESFHENSSKNELYYEMSQGSDPNALGTLKTIPEEPNEKCKKLTAFHGKISEKLLHETFLTTSFNQLMQEIFKIKYHKIGETICNHEYLAKEYNDIFGSEGEGITYDKKIVHQTQEKFDHLKTSLKDVKLNIDTCHAEISDLCSHVLNRLFDPRPQIARKDNEEESKMDSGENGSSGDGKDSSDGKFKGNRPNGKLGSNNNGNSSGSHSSGNNGTNGNQESGLDGSSSNGNASGNARASSDQSEPNPRKAIKKTKPRYATAKSKLPKKATDILKNWFLANIQNPYPNCEAKDALSKVTNLSKKQIQNWFTNSRKRFLEPLRKKLQANQDLNIRDMSSPAENRFNPENNFNQNPIPSKPEEPLQYQKEQPIIQQRPEPSFQPQQNVTYITQPNYNQPMVYQAHMATNQNGGTVMVLTPYIIQPSPIMYSYRPVQNIVPIGNNFLQFQNNNSVQVINQPNHVQVINQPYIEQPYMIPTNVVDFRGIMTQSLSTNFNTINNNVYNSINKIGSEDSVSSNLGNNTNPMGSDTSQDKNLGISHLKPEHEPEQNLSNNPMLREDDKK
jgi:hypothetical protein